MNDADKRFAHWTTDRLGYHEGKDTWFIVDSTQKDTVAGFDMRIVWAKNLMPRRDAGRSAIAKTDLELMQIRDLGRAEAHEVFTAAFAEMGRAVKRWRKFGVAQSFAGFTEDMQMALRMPAPLRLAQYMRETAHHQAYARENKFSTVADFLDLHQSLFAVFSTLMTAVYGKAAQPVLSALRQDLFDEKPIAPLSLTLEQVILPAPIIKTAQLGKAATAFSGAVRKKRGGNWNTPIVREGMNKAKGAKAQPQ